MKIRTKWNEDQGEWFFSTINVVGNAINLRKYV
jgi:hypothetical protein